MGPAIAAIRAIPRIVEGIEMVGSVIDTAGKHAKQLGSILQRLTGNWLEVNDAAFKTARTMAFGREQALQFNKQLLTATRELATQYGVTAKELADFQKSYAEAVGRNVVLTKEQLAHMSAFAKITDSATAGRLVDEFDKVGIGIRSSLAHVGHMQEKAKAFGVNATKASKSLASNIKLASMYSFKNGVADIEKMTIQSAALRANMDAIMRSSEKFSTIEGALETSAKLQMLGGQVGAFGANPMANMYNALADPAQYMKDVTTMAKSLVTYDKKTGETTMNPIQAMTAKATAENLGMSQQEFMEMAYAGVKNDAVKQQVGNRGFTDEQMEGIANLARGNFDETTGKYFVTWLQDGKEQKKFVDKISKDELKIAQDSQATEENMMMDVKDIKTILERVHGRARETTSAKEDLQGANEWWETTKANLADGILKPLANSFNWLTKTFLGKQYFSSGGIAKPVHAAMGTIVPGDSYSGDRVPAMLNSGEMVLNPAQQKSMFNMISSLALNGGMFYGMNKLGGKMGVGGLGSTMLMANMIGGQDAGIKEMVEAHFLKKFIKGMKPFKKSVEGVGKVAEEATKSTSAFKTHWGEFTGQLSKDWNSLTNSLSDSWHKFSRRVSVSSRRYFTTGRWGKVTSTIGNAGKAVGRFTTTAWDGTAKYAKVFGNAVYDKAIKPLTSTISTGWNSLKDSKFGNKVGHYYRNRVADAKMAKAMSLDWFDKKTEGIRGRYGNLQRQAHYFKKDVLQPKTQQYKQLVKNLFNDGSKAQASKIASRYGKLGTPEVAMTGRVTGVSQAAETTAKAANNSGKLMSGLSKVGKSLAPAAKFISKKLPVIGNVLAVGGAISSMSSASSQYDAKIDEIERSGMSDLDKARAKDRAAKEKNASYGSSIGSVAGTAIGGALGSALGPLGTVAGMWLGEKAGSFLGKGIGSLFGGGEEKKVKEEREKLFAGKEGIAANEDAVKILTSIDKKLSVISGKSIALRGNELARPALSPIDMMKKTAMTAKKVASVGFGAISGIFPPVAAARLLSRDDKEVSIKEQFKSAVKPHPITGNFMKVSPLKSSEAVISRPTLGKTDVNLNVSGTIKLEGGGKSVDFDLSKLLETPEFKRQLADIITRRLNENSNSGKRNMESERNNMASQYNRSGK